ncbi:TetR/AcrR family transcriptional regulator [Kribbella speibonae]|uniref:TetR family transcriptional regulator n=1 Tax=Kribbella speibonae TaxID=1572660 RepID=A0A4R0JA94_9ACTN|nr:TetR family transcriptional regulator [Kribbella speibonae]TCC18256.1 TetR family transcriptional regulator [Kribbella speibonae]TCC42264.1 TetR family transcriptional regulator [Kribbella speibonae]
MAVKDSHRARQAQATKEQVARAARVLFRQQGYVATTIAAISDAAEIPAQTIYSAFGNKPAILREIARIWIAEADTRRLAQESLALADPAERLRAAAHWNTRQFVAGIDVIQIYQEAARADPRMADEMQRVWAAREHELKLYLESFDGDLAQPQDRALDIFLACTTAEVYRLLVSDRGWSEAEYETWLGDTLVSQLLP